MTGSTKPRAKQELGRTTSVLQCDRASDKVVLRPRDLPGNIILIHGVNDVGAGFGNAEEGLCAGLEQRLYRRFTPGKYRIPTQADKNKVEDDPDAVFFKRSIDQHTDSPVIPFYWGFREVSGKTRTVHGQFVDRYGNRLDKDLSKGGGPFGNATSNIPDMWNKGIGAPMDPVKDKLRPVNSAPGRMYMVLAALRLACLIASIRRYESKDTVTLLAHSQGCLLSLLAQAYLLEKGERPADTLILTHPPYSLEEQPNEHLIRIISAIRGGEDAPMKPHYDALSGWQSLHGRLQTLINIVHGVAKAKASEPAFHSISEKSCTGMVEGRWQPGGDRDNRGKVFLYFCPEDMTVALDNMRGIGWQGVPDHFEGAQAGHVYKENMLGRGGSYQWASATVKRKPLQELGEGFRQRVFTGKSRLDPATGKIAPVLVGAPPHDFALRVNGEDDHAHVAASGREHRAALPVAQWPLDPQAASGKQRLGIRRINAEPLKAPCVADISSGQIAPKELPATSMHAKTPLDERGPYEEVDPITAAIATTSFQGLKVWSEVRPGPTRGAALALSGTQTAATKPAFAQSAVPGGVAELKSAEVEYMTRVYNEEKLAELKQRGILDDNSAKHPNEQYKIIRALRYPDGRVVATIQESINGARRRWQHEYGAKSFHSVIFDSRENHRRVTAYDVAIGSGKASSDPLHYRYLCAVADWRLKKPTPPEKPRPGILTWEKFAARFKVYYNCEPDWCKALIEGNADYYSSGVLPECLPVLTGELWNIIVSETISGVRVNQPVAPNGK